MTIFSKLTYPFCVKAKQLLMNNKLQFEEVFLDHNTTTVSLRAITGSTTVPQIFISGKHI